MEAALDLLQLTSEDVLVDIGAGDGSFVIRAAQGTAVGAAVGIEICEERVAAADIEIAGAMLVFVLYYEYIYTYIHTLCLCLCYTMNTYTHIYILF